jgi:glutathione S-transferase
MKLKDQPQLGGDTPCAADIGIFPFVRQFAAVQPAWFHTLPLPAVKAWLAGWLAHPLFEKVMVKTAIG